MFEFTISGSSDRNTIDYTYTLLKPAVEGFNGIIVMTEEGCIKSVCLAVDNKNVFYIKSAILDAISDSIISVYKHEFLAENISICIRNNIAKDSFIKALVVFDRQTDKDLIIKSLVLDDNINIDSFYSFRLHELKQRWTDICNIVNESVPVLLKDKSVAELTRYFINGTENKTNEIHLFISKNNINLTIDNKPSDLIFNSEDCASDIVSEIISLCPNKILVHGNLDNFKELKNTLNSVFMDKIYVCD